MAETAYLIEAHHVDIFTDLTYLRAQQLTSKTRDKIIVENASGRNYYFDQVGKTEMRETNERYPPSPHQDIEHFRRKVTLNRVDWGQNLDDQDTVQSMTSNEGKYVIAASGAYARTFDTKVINAALGDAITEAPDGTTTTVSLPSTQKVAVTFGATNGTDDVNMNEAKAREALRILAANDVDLDDPINQPCGWISPAAFYSGLMGQEAFTSSDYNGSKPLVNGQFTFTWMGMPWVVTNRLPLVAGEASERRCIIAARSGIGMALWKDLTVRKTVRGDLSLVDYIYMDSFLGATRLEEEKVVEVICEESASAVAA